MAETIRRVGSQPVCTDTFGVVIKSDGGQITLQNGQIIRYGSETQIKISVKGKDTKVKDDRKVDVGSIVLIYICTRADGTIIVDLVKYKEERGIDETVEPEEHFVL